MNAISTYELMIAPSRLSSDNATYRDTAFMPSSAERGLLAYADEQPEALHHACAAIRILIVETPWPLRSAAMLGARIHSLVSALDDGGSWFADAMAAFGLRFSAHSGWRSDLLDAALTYSLHRSWLLRSTVGFEVSPSAPKAPGPITAAERAALRFSAAAVRRGDSDVDVSTGR